MHVSTGELIMIVVIVMIVFSASRMGALGNAVGKFVYSFKKAAKGDDVIDVKPTRKIDAPPEDAKIIDSPPKL